MYSLIFTILNIDIIAGICLVSIGSITATDFFKGRRITLIALSILINFTWNIIWLSLNKVKTDNSFTELDMDFFDRIMYRVDCSMSAMVY